MDAVTVVLMVLGAWVALGVVAALMLGRTVHLRDHHAEGGLAIDRALPTALPTQRRVTEEPAVRPRGWAVAP